MVGNVRSVSDYESAALSAADILLRNIMGILSTTKYNNEKLSHAANAFHAILWNKSILSKIGGRRIADFLVRARSPRLPKGEFRALVSILSLASCDDSQIFPFALEAWRKVIVRFQLYDRIPFATWLSIVYRLQESNINSPYDFSRYSYAEANRLAVELADAVHILALWQGACIAHTSESAAGTLLPFRQNAAIAAQAFRVANIDDSRPARKRASLIESLELGDSFEDIGPAAKIHKFANSGVLPEQLIDFTRAGAELNVMRQTMDSLPSVASGISCYAAFCDLMGSHISPPHR